MNKDFLKGLAVGCVFVGVIGGAANFVICKQEDKIKRYRKMVEILVEIAEGLEEYVDPDIVKGIIDLHEFDAMMLIEFE